MLSAPMIAAAMATTFDFQWAFPFLGQTNTAGALTGECHFKEAYKIFDEFGLAEKATTINVDGCAANASSREHEGVDAWGITGKSMVSRWNVLRESEDKEWLLRFHCICHILALCVGDMMKLAPPFFTKYLRNCWRLVGKSAQRRASFNTLSADLQKAIHDCVHEFTEINSEYGNVTASPKR